MQFRDFLNEMAFSTGSVSPARKAVLPIEPLDKEIWNYVRQQVHAAAADRALLARYFYTRSDLQIYAQSKGVYYKNIDMNVQGNPGILVVAGSEIPIKRTDMSKLKERIKGVDLHILGDKMPNKLIQSAFNKGYIALNYHSKTYYSSNMWQNEFKTTHGEKIKFTSEEEFRHALEHGYKDIILHIGNNSVSLYELRNMVLKQIDNAIRRGILPSDNDRRLYLSGQIIHAIYVKLGKINSSKDIHLIINCMINDSSKKSETNNYNSRMHDPRWIQGKGDVRNNFLYNQPHTEKVSKGKWRLSREFLNGKSSKAFLIRTIFNAMSVKPSAIAERNRYIIDYISKNYPDFIWSANKATDIQRAIQGGRKKPDTSPE